ncbi:MAG: dienelactone hydrolase family protein [Pseudomonadota bacterium]
MSLLPYLEVEPQQPATASVIWLHGLGADGHDFEPIAKELNLPDSLAIRFIFPHAPSMPVTINNGMVMPAWYDVLGAAIDDVIDIKGIKHSAEKINLLIEQEISRGISSDRIILAGFSQGGAVAYECALSYPKKLGGLMALSTYYATHQQIQLSAINKDIPILVCHGSDDAVVAESLAHRAIKRLEDKAYRVEYKSYPMQHNVCIEEIDDISMWLQKIL